MLNLIVSSTLLQTVGGTFTILFSSESLGWIDVNNYVSNPNAKHVRQVMAVNPAQIIRVF